MNARYGTLNANKVVVTDSPRIPQAPVQNEPKKRGRKRGSKGVDSRLTDNVFSSQSNSVYDSGSLLSLKTKIESIRGSKKVKTTKELLADLQNRKSAISGESCGSNYGSKTSSPVGYISQTQTAPKPLHIQSVPSPSLLSGTFEANFLRHFTYCISINTIVILMSFR